MAAALAALNNALQLFGANAEERDALNAQGFAALADLGTVTRSSIQQSCKAIRHAGLLPNNTPFTFRASNAIEVLWFWYNDRIGHNQPAGVADLNATVARYYLQTYRNIINRNEADHDNEYEVPAYTDKTSFIEWQDQLLVGMEDDKFSADQL